jgi:hypothetical protein
LNIGSGRTTLPGFEPWDIKDRKPGFPLGVPDNSIGEIYASHVLEHFSWRETQAVLSDWFRALEPGARCRVAVPDFDKIISLHGKGDCTFTEAYLFGGQIDSDDHHHCAFTEQTLRTQMEKAGLVNIGPWQSEIQDCAALPISLNLQGFKPVPPPADPSKPLKIVAVTSQAKLGFSDTESSIFNALPGLGMQLLRGMGVFWGQRLENMIEMAIDKYQADAILAIDADSLFTQDDVRRLIDLLQRHPEADAISAHQWNRAADKPLWTVLSRLRNGPKPITAQELLSGGDLFEIDTACFGLTLIRTSALQSMTHPWFLSQPNAEGRWGPGKIDEDIYFWAMFKRAGKRLFLAPRATIGHIEIAVRWPGKDLNLLWQHMYEYYDHGRPKEAFGADESAPGGPGTTPASGAAGNSTGV